MLKKEILHRMKGLIIKIYVKFIFPAEVFRGEWMDFQTAA